MRVRSLELTRYGSFTGRAIDLGPGLTVVHGPNESGKSTLGSALGDLLWGIHSRSHPYAFRVAATALCVTAIVDRPPGIEPTSLVVTTRGHRDSRGSVVSPWWRDGSVTSRESWTTSLGMDRDGLRRGGRDVLRSGGDLAPLLFRARTGVDLQEARDSLRSQATDLYRRHQGAKRVRVREAAVTVDDARRRLQEATSSAAEVVRLRAELDRAEDEFHDRDRAHNEARLEEDAAEELVRAWEPLQRLRVLQKTMTALRSQGRLLDKVDLDSYRTARGEIEDLHRRLARVEQRISGFERQLTDLVVDDDALALAPQVEDLCDQRVAERERAHRLMGLRHDQTASADELRRAVATLQPDNPMVRDGAADLDALVLAANGLVVPDDVADRLNREAAELRLRTGALARSQAEVAAAEQHRSERAGRAASGTAHRDLPEARQRRQRAWQRVRDPWLAGFLPDEEARGLAVADVERETLAADEIADDAAREAELLGRRMEADTAWARHIGEAKHCADLASDAQQTWSSLLREAGLPSVLDPDAWDVRRAASTRIQRIINDLASVARSIRVETETANRFESNVRSVCSQLGICGDEYLADLAKAEQHVSRSETNRSAAEGYEQGLRQARTEKSTVLEELSVALAVVKRLSSDDDDLVEVADRSEEFQERQAEARVAEGQLRTAASLGANLDELVARVGTSTLPELESERDRAREHCIEALDHRDLARKHRDDLKEQLASAEREGTAAELRARVREAEEVLVGKVEEYLQLRVMTALLDRMLAAEQPEDDSALLRHASHLAQTLTEGRVTALSVEDLDGSPRLRIEAAGLAEGVADELSEGTADQVYLALRLAGIRQLQSQAVASGSCALPVLLDDVLMAHDDSRTAVALQVLADEAADQQIVLTTHHLSVAEQARECGAHVVTLEPLPDQSVQDVAAAAEPRGHADGDPDPAAVRAWARAQNLDVGERGRIKGWIVQAYLARDTPDLDA